MSKITIDNHKFTGNKGWKEINEILRRWFPTTVYSDGMTDYEYAKADITAHINKAVADARIDEVRKLYWDISQHPGRYIKGRSLQYLEEREKVLKQKGKL